MANDGLHLFKNIGQLPVVALQAPSGRWFLSGSVRVAAAYERKDGAPLTADDIAAIKHCGPGFARACRARTYDSKEAALAAAEAA